MTLLHPRSPTIVCFGEALWDILPRGIFLGGAPLNVAYHLLKQRVSAVPVSAVGRDFLGDEALRRVTAWGLEPRFITRLPAQSTGTVRAALDAQGSATYRILRNVAWDKIAVPAALLRRREPAAIVFGTLALREAPNRRALMRLLSAWPNAVRVLDLNLRAPFDRGAAIDFALRHTQVLKLNADELVSLVQQPGRSPSQLERGARRLSAQRKLPRICVTAGARGAGLLWDGRWWWEPGRRIEVRDTIGAGDAFLAAFLAESLIRKNSPSRALKAACRMGEFVASCDGATPPYRCDPHGRPRR